MNQIQKSERVKWFFVFDIIRCRDNLNIEDRRPNKCVRQQQTSTETTLQCIMTISFKIIQKPYKFIYFPTITILYSPNSYLPSDKNQSQLWYTQIIKTLNKSSPTVTNLTQKEFASSISIKNKKTITICF